MRVVRFFAVFFLICAVNCRPSELDDDDYGEPEPGMQNDDYDYNEGDDDTMEVGEILEPNFVTKPQDFIAKENETVHLPCELNNGDNAVFMWRKNNELIFQDTIKFSSFGSNFQIANRTLVIANVGANETANYTCSIPISNTNIKNITHRLFVETAPKILSLRAQHDIVQLDAGKTLVLTCDAIGFPRPTIKWSRKGQRLADEGERVTLENIGLHDAGDYQCLADNDIEPPAHKFIHIGVAHKPMVKIEKLTVNAEQNLDAELICYVHAVPRADVVWQKDGLNIVSNPRKLLKNYNNTHILEIKMIQNSDFGVYSCAATNRVGKSDKNVTLTAYPSPADLIVTHVHSHVRFIWKLESKAPISKYSLEYRKLSAAKWKSAAPLVTNPDGNIYTGNFSLEDLPHGEYEAKVRSQNTYGWSDYSPVVKFKSGHAHHKTEPPTLIPKPALVTRLAEVGSQPQVPAEPKDPFGNEVFDHTEKPIVAQTTPTPVKAPPKEQHNANNAQKPQSQEHQLQPQTGQGGGAAVLVPALSLLCIAALSTLYSR